MVRPTSLASILLLSTACAATVQAAPVVDASYVGGATNRFFAGPVDGNGLNLAQTFTVGLAGALTHVDVYAARTGDTTAPLILEIRTTTAGAPDRLASAVLATANVPASAVPVAGPDFNGTNDYTVASFVGVDLTGLFVTPGQVLAIGIRSGAFPGGYVLPYTSQTPSGYAGGTRFLRGNSTDVYTQSSAGDHFFRTYVDAAVSAPEPASLGLLGVAALPALARRRRRA